MSWRLPISHAERPEFAKRFEWWWSMQETPCIVNGKVEITAAWYYELGRRISRKGKAFSMLTDRQRSKLFKRVPSPPEGFSESADDGKNIFALPKRINLAASNRTIFAAIAETLEQARSVRKVTSRGAGGNPALRRSRHFDWDVIEALDLRTAGYTLDADLRSEISQAKKRYAKHFSQF